MENSISKKITLATVKSFIRKNRPNLYVKVTSDFDGMTDGVEFYPNAQFQEANCSGNPLNRNTCGISGVWFVSGSRNWFSKYENDGFVGYKVSNCCGSFVLAVKK